ncbi:HAMP domain-containing histidine kinase [Blastopirellula sp. J2-11]|uniref:HAMP domain-containing histidine kinase n=1 Tax=Blastopirellula sp. J2-11 TaxID=2943192 RepID=UPI0021C66C6D|nr:HAMP domain-containing histidine kinase [Blastopirellula sp. J2-11]UUO07070.1 HAMP domain-containing histidine kinase [Blastopirellula sp. J2-11]
MRLVNRISIFFLAALAICLIGYSATMYVLIRHHLYHEFDDHLRNSLHVLSAAIEVESDAVKWQPSEHTIHLGDDQDEVRWLIVEEPSGVVDASGNLNLQSDADHQLLKIGSRIQSHSGDLSRFGHWRILQSRLVAPAPKPTLELDSDEYPHVIVTVAHDSYRLDADLWRLALLACGLPTILWIFAAVVGRAYCRRALRPVTEMANQTRLITGFQSDARLPVSRPADELASLAAAFNDLLDRLQKSYHQQQRFTSDAAHQLRTPLTVLLGQIDVAMRRPRSEAEYRDLLQTLREQTDELQKMVSSLLFIARAEGDAQLPDRETLVLTTWLQSVRKRWDHHPRSADISFILSHDATLTTSVSLLSQAIDNLLQNAVKYSPPGSPITLSTHAISAQQLEITVSDAGVGISPEELESIFDPFFRSSSARRNGTTGVGLGLTIVSRIAGVLGGNIVCDSQPGNGSRFTLRLPCESTSVNCVAAPS